MSSISKCPKCAEQVTIPDGVAAEAQVRCPLCGAEYPLSDALAGVPPALIPVAIVNLVPAAPEAPPAPAPADAVEALAATPAEPALADTAHLEPEVTLDTSAEPLAAPAPETAISETPTLHPWEKIEDLAEAEAEAEARAEAEEGEPAAEADDEHVDAAMFGVVKVKKEPEEGRPEEQPPVPLKRRRRREPRPVRTLIGLAVSGALGIVLGYFILRLCGIDLLQQYWGRSRSSQASKSEPAEGNSTAKKAGQPDPSWYMPKIPGLEPPIPDLSKPELPIPTLPTLEPSIDLPAAKPLAPKPSTPDPPAEEPAVTTPAVEEPSPTEPKTATLQADYVGPRDPPSFTADKLAAAVKEAEEAFTSSKMSEEAFTKFCRLAEVATFAEAGDADRAKAVKDLLQQVGKAPDQVAEIGRRAAAALEVEQPNGGILLAGTVLKVGIRGKLHGLTIEMPPMTKAVSVMSRQPLGVEGNDRVVIVGTIVPSPGKNLVGFEGERPMVIWADMAVKLPAE